MQEYFHPLVDAVDNVQSKEGVSRQLFVVMPLKAINVSCSHGHSPDKGSLMWQVLPIHLHKAACALTELLYGGNYLEAVTRRAGVEELTMILPPWSIERERVGSLLMWF